MAVDGDGEEDERGGRARRRPAGGGPPAAHGGEAPGSAARPVPGHSLLYARVR